MKYKRHIEYITASDPPKVSWDPSSAFYKRQRQRLNSLRVKPLEGTRANHCVVLTDGKKLAVLWSVSPCICHSTWKSPLILSFRFNWDSIL